MLFMSLYLHINIFTRQPGLFVTIDELKYHLYNDESTVNIVNQITYTVVQKNPETM